MKSIIRVALLMLFIGYWSSITLFPHTHFLQGEKIVHSHPYKKSGGGCNHTHTSSQIQLITHLSLLLMLAATIAGSLNRYSVNITTRYLEKVSQYYKNVVTHSSLRGPPSFC